MRKRITGLSLILAFLLAPLTGVLAGVCHCDHETADAVEFAPIPCCGETPACCGNHNEGHVVTPIIAELDQQSRGDFKPAIRQPVHLLPAPVAVVALKQNFVKSTGPPGTGVRELSLRQVWLI